MDNCTFGVKASRKRKSNPYITVRLNVDFTCLCAEVIKLELMILVCVSTVVIIFAFLSYFKF